MLNRRHLRIKVFQAIYSYLRGAKNDLGVGEKELITCINRIHELFILHVSVFTELQRFASKRLEERRNKKLPSEQDLNPNLRFVNNELLMALVNSDSLQKKVEQYKISWVANDDIIPKLFKTIEASETFQRFMNAPEYDLETQKSFVLKLYREFVADNEILQDLLKSEVFTGPTITTLFVGMW